LALKWPVFLSSLRAAAEKREDNMIPENTIYAKRDVSKGRGKARYLNPDGDSLFVEQVALKHYSSSGYRGLWSENVYWWQLATLLYWDVVYKELPGVYEPEFDFPSRSQDLPFDIFDVSFYTRRQVFISTRHQALKSSRWFGLRQPSLKYYLKTAWNKHKGKTCRFFGSWDKFSLNDLMLAALGLDPTQMNLIVERLFHDFSENRKGFPDLFLVKDNQPQFAEVKRKGEQISPHQTEWHMYLYKEVGIPVEICRVIDE